MIRPMWHDVVIAIAVVALTVLGVRALWGEDILRIFEDDPPAAPAPDTPVLDQQPA